MFETLGEKDTRRLLNALKTFMKYREWPLAVVLTGIPALLGEVNLDPQSDDLEEVDTASYKLAATIGADISELRREDTYLRMAYGHQAMYERVFRFMVDVLASLPHRKRR